jgi:hypothetical protein
MILLLKIKMTWLLFTIFSSFLNYTWNDLSDKIQEKYVVEHYFEWVNDQSPIVYRNGRILWQQFSNIEWGQYTNRTDCGWVMVWYMMSLDLIKSRRKTTEWDSFTYDGGWLNSFRLYTLWSPVSRANVKRGDFVYMEFPSGSRHFAVSCNDWATEIFDIYKQSFGECRTTPRASKMLFSKNWVVEFLKKEGIQLKQTQDILYSIYSYNENITWTGEQIELEENSSFIDIFNDYISFILLLFSGGEWEQLQEVID